MACFSKWDIGQCGCACSLSVLVKGCGSTPLAVGSGLTVNLKVGGSTVYTGTTDSTGTASMSGAAGTYDVEVVDGRTPSRWTTQTFTAQSLSCGTPVAVTLTTVKSGFHCTSNNCGDPVADTLYATDANGTWTLTYSGGTWSGCATHTSMASVVTNLNAGVCTKITGTANTPYVINYAGISVGNTWGAYQAPFNQQTSATPSCSAGVLDYNATIPVSCFGSIGVDSASMSPTIVCPPSFSLSGTMPGSSAVLGTTNPGAGSITITE